MKASAFFRISSMSSTLSSRAPRFRVASRSLESNVMGDLLAQLPPSDDHGPHNQPEVGTIEQQSFNLPIERQSPHRAGQKTKCLSTPRI